MRVVLDLQACQSSGSRTRGIGRFGWELALAMLQQAGGDEFWVALNAALPESAQAIQHDLAHLVPDERFFTWRVPGPTAAADPRNNWRAASGEVLRESLLETLNPDWVHIGNLFQGFVDDSLESVPIRADAAPVAVTHHDLIPLVYPDDYITSPQAKGWYARRLESLRRASLVLTNSEFTRCEAIELLGLQAHRVVCISCAASRAFTRTNTNFAASADVLAGCDITRPFVMYAGGADPRKNVEGLIRAFGLLPPEVRQEHQLVLVGREPAERRDALLRVAMLSGLNERDLVFPGFVADSALITLYNTCTLFIFPSFREGFGLPVLEAMACGAPTIASDASSLPEVVGWPEALFDPHRDEGIAEAIHKVLVDTSFRKELADRGMNRAKLFTWERSARRALDAMRSVDLARGDDRRARDGQAKRPPGVDHTARQGLAR